MLNVYMMDLWCQVPFYNAYLCQALRGEGIACTLGSTRFHLEPDYFRQRKLNINPGLCSVVSGLKVGGTRMRRSLKFLEFCGNLSSLTARFLAIPPDIIHVQWIPLVDQGLQLELWFLEVARKRGIKLAYTVHNVLPHDVEIGLKEIFADVYRLMDALICHTQDARQRLIEEFGLAPEKISVIPHGPLFYDCAAMEPQEAKRQLGFSEDDCVVLHQGNVRPYKGLEFLLEAWKSVQASRPNARLLVVGTGETSWLKKIEDRVDALDLRSSVRLDFRYVASHRLPLYYHAADIAVYPYREITQSGALMTGIAFGKPIIATSLPGLREALNGGGLLVEYGDVQGLAMRLDGLIRDPQAREKLARKPSIMDCQKSWSTIAKQTRDCYARLLGGARAAELPSMLCDAPVSVRAARKQEL